MGLENLGDQYFKWVYLEFKPKNVMFLFSSSLLSIVFDGDVSVGFCP